MDDGRDVDSTSEPGAAAKSPADESRADKSSAAESRADNSRADRTPDLTRDELERGWGERARDPGSPSEADEWLLAERPPHWE